MAVSSMARLRWLGLIMLVAIAPVSAEAQKFPSRPITIIIPFPAGGITDQALRMAAQRLTDNTGWVMTIENRSGGGGQIAATAVKSARPDGHVLLIANIGSHAINQSLYSKLSYSPVDDFAPITMLIAFPHVLVVPSESPFKTVDDLIAAAKEKPGGLTYASQGIGSSGHLLAEMLKAHSKIDIVHVPYRGTAHALPDLLAGRVQFFFDGIPGSSPLVAEGKLRALAVTDKVRVSVLPNIPTMAEAGYPGFEMTAWFGLVAPAGTPRPIIDKLNAEFTKAMSSMEIVKSLASLGVNVITNSPEEFATFMALQTVWLGRIVKESGARAD